MAPLTLSRLERVQVESLRLAEALGQKAEILEKIRQGELHPAMAAFGLWSDEPSLERLAEEIAAGRAGSAMPKSSP